MAKIIISWRHQQVWRSHQYRNGAVKDDYNAPMKVTAASMAAIISKHEKVP